jgi:hypothetical protein
MLAASRGVTYVNEPLNTARRPAFLDPLPRYRFPYLTEDDDTFECAFQNLVALRYPVRAALRTLSSPRDVLRLAKYWTSFAWGRQSGRRALLKDPYAVLSARWFARLGCRVVLTVRHPAAIVSSRIRLGWKIDFRDFLDQGALMRDWLEPFRGDLETALEKPDDGIFHGCLLWRVIYSVAAGFRQLYPEFLVVRHEDLSRDPLEGYRALYARLELPFTDEARSTIEASSRAENRDELSLADPHGVRLDSLSNLSNWTRRLDRDQIERIRRLTDDVWPLFYDEQDWEPGTPQAAGFRHSP